MTMFAAALAAFILLHIGVSATPLRGALVRGIGEGPYRGLFSLASAGALAWMIFAYAAARAAPDNPTLWISPAWTRHVAATLVLLGFLLAVAGLLTPGPTLAGFEGALKKPDAAKGILRVTRHPFLWGVALWGVGHLFANGEGTSVMLFGGLAVMSLLGTRSIDRKSAARMPAEWAPFRDATSNVPFAAILKGRNRLAVGEMAIPLLAALAAFGAMVWFHRVLFGVAPFAFGA
ncbi:MAG: NnrU family protein [Hyphomonadaceae bacterium]|nr:MAG: hypothetical protein FD160_3417 [Caulobacteraceae bacterium]MBT9446507.1 NnrU family protein [Hyphomonadaceae bacterium]TPW07935.1 MAG: hypothetical protein FD124_776 [Alphaproteobacteria bacterium]